MSHFLNPGPVVTVPGLNELRTLPPYETIYGDVLKSLDPAKRDNIHEKLFFTSWLDKPMIGIFYGLGLLERYAILQQRPDELFSPESYAAYQLRARRLMELFGCVTSSYLEDEELCRAFLNGVVDFFNKYNEIFP